MKSVRIAINCFNVTPPAGINASNGVCMKVSLVYDSQINGGSVPNYTDIYNLAQPISAINLNNRDRFRIIWTKMFDVAAFVITAGASGVLSAGSPSNTYKGGYKKLNLPVIFGGTTATIGSITTGALYLCVCSDLASAGAFDYDVRVRFVDN